MIQIQIQTAEIFRVLLGGWSASFRAVDDDLGPRYAREHALVFTNGVATPCGWARLTSACGIDKIVAVCACERSLLKSGMDQKASPPLAKVNSRLPEVRVGDDADVVFLERMPMTRR